MIQVEPNQLEVLPKDECLQLLARSALGRIAVSVGALPVILPVIYLVDGGVVLIRAGHGTKLDAAMRETVVAFEVDEVEPDGHSGWSVCVVGTAHEVTDPVELERIGRLPLPHWAPNGGSHVICISTEVITGRRLPSARLTSDG